MTLSTDLYVHDAIDLGELFAFCQDAIAGYDTHQRPASAQQWEDDKGNAAFQVRRNKPNQQLPAALSVTHRGDMPLLPEPEGCSEDCEPGCKLEHSPACWAHVNLDTAYYYRGTDDVKGCCELQRYWWRPSANG
jgi:hypothetical protein